MWVLDVALALAGWQPESRAASTRPQLGSICLAHPGWLVPLPLCQPASSEEVLLGFRLGPYFMVRSLPHGHLWKQGPRKWKSVH